MMKKLLLLLTLCIGMVSPAAFAQDETEDPTDYKTACLAAIDNINLIGNSFSMRSMISIAKTSLDACSTKDGMRRTMTTLRAGVTTYLRTTSTFSDEQVFTGLLGNHSFDTGDLSLWYSVTFDLSQLSLTDIMNAIDGGDVSGLGEAISVNVWNEDTKPIENTGSKAMQGGDGKYYLNSTQLVMQPIMGLKAGIYSFSAKVACNPGFFSMSSVHLSTLVIPMSTVQEVLGDVIGDNPNWEEILNNFDLTPYMGTFLENGKFYTASVSCKNLNTFSDGELRFIIDEGDIILIGMNAGMMPFIGTDQFRADNLQLTGLRAADQILTPAKADLATALDGLSLVEANYNADLEDTAAQPAFTYDKTVTEQYNNAYRTAKDKYDNDGLADLLSKEDLQNIDGIAAKLQGHYSSEIQVLGQAKDAFEKQGLIAPETDESFNIVMKDSWISLLTPQWTGNAVTIDENKSMSFGQQPGQSVFALAFGFERTSNTYTNQLRAFVYDYRDKYYLGETNGNLVLTANPNEAVTITALPSYTEEGEIQLMIGDMYLGTSNSSNALIKTDSGTLLRPTRTGLAVLPALEMGITFTLPPTGGNARTLILPFDAELPEGITACTVTGINPDLLFIEGEAVTSLNANTPYIIMANGSADSEENLAEAFTFSGVPHALQLSYTEGLLIGRHTPYTTQGANEYKLTMEEDGFCLFRRMDGQTIAENECYLKCDAPSDIICLSPEDATGIGEMKSDDDSMHTDAIYDLSGREINSKLRKGIYIVNGKKVAFK